MQSILSTLRDAPEQGVTLTQIEARMVFAMLARAAPATPAHAKLLVFITSHRNGISRSKLKSRFQSIKAAEMDLILSELVVEDAITATREINKATGAARTVYRAAYE